MSIRIPPPVQTAFWGLVIWGLDYLAPDLSFNFTGHKTLGRAFIVIGLFIVLISVGAFIKARTTVNPIKPENASELVTQGLYRISRNPMYLGMLFLLIGMSFIIANPLSLIGIFGFIWVMNQIQIKPEETALDSLFGESYHNYKNQVRRWI